MQRLRMTPGRRGGDRSLRHRLEQRLGDLRTRAVPGAQEQDPRPPTPGIACRGVRRWRRGEPQPGMQRTARGLELLPAPREIDRVVAVPSDRPSCDACARARPRAADPGGTTPGSAARRGAPSAREPRGRCARARAAGATAGDAPAAARIRVDQPGLGVTRRSAARVPAYPTTPITSNRLMYFAARYSARRRAISVHATAAAALTFNDARCPCIGIDATTSQRAVRAARVRDPPRRAPARAARRRPTGRRATGRRRRRGRRTTRRPGAPGRARRDPGHERDRQVLERTGRRLRHRRRQPDGTVRGQDHAGRARGLRAAHHRAEVLRVGDPVEGDEERAPDRRAARRDRRSAPARRTRPRPAARGAGAPLDLVARAPAGCARRRARPAARSRRPRRRRRRRSKPEVVTLRRPAARSSRTARRPSTCWPRSRRSRFVSGWRRRAVARAAAPAHRRQIVPPGVSSSLMPRAVRSSRMLVGAGEVARRPGVVALAHQRVDLVVGVVRRVAEGEPEHPGELAHGRDAATPRGRGRRRRAHGCASRTASKITATAPGGVEVVVHRGAEPLDRRRRRRVAAGVDARGGARRAQRVEPLDALAAAVELGRPEVDRRAGSATATPRAGTRARPYSSSASASVVKLPSDFDIFSPPTVHHAAVDPVARERVAGAPRPGRARSRGAGTRGRRRRRGGRTLRPGGPATSPSTRCANPAGPDPRASPRRARPASPPSRARSPSGCAWPRRRRPGRRPTRAAPRASGAAARRSPGSGRRRSTRPGRRPRRRARGRRARRSRSCIPSMYSVACGRVVGAAGCPGGPAASKYTSSNSRASSGSVRPRSAARAMILSSTSVTLLTYVTSSPVHSRYRRIMSNTSGGAPVADVRHVVDGRPAHVHRRACPARASSARRCRAARVSRMRIMADRG